MSGSAEAANALAAQGLDMLLNPSPDAHAELRTASTGEPVGDFPEGLTLRNEDTVTIATTRLVDPAATD